MTTGLAVLGACHIVTALGLRPAAVPGRWLLAIGGASTLVVAAAPQPVHGSARVHIVAATIGFVALAVWSLAASRTDGPAVLRRRTGAIATVLLLAMLGWLGGEIGSGSLLGLSERVLAGTQALWPFAVVLLLRSRRTQAARMAP